MSESAAIPAPPPESQPERKRVPFRRTALGPHSKLFRRGAVGRLNGNSGEAKYVATVERALIEHVGGAPSIAEKLLIARLARIMLRLSLLDEKIAAGEATDHDAKIVGGLDSALRNGLSRLGLKKGATTKPPTLHDYLAAKASTP